MQSKMNYRGIDCREMNWRGIDCRVMDCNGLQSKWITEEWIAE